MRQLPLVVLIFVCVTVNAAAPIYVPPKAVTLDWQYPQSLPCGGLAFEIWTQWDLPIPQPPQTNIVVNGVTNLVGILTVRNGVTNYWAPPLVIPSNGWVRLTNVSSPPVVIKNVLSNQFFIVRATNSVTKKFSDWSRHDK